MKDATNFELVRAGFWGALGGAAFYLGITALVLLLVPRPDLTVKAQASGDCGCGCGGK